MVQYDNCQVATGCKADSELEQLLNGATFSNHDTLSFEFECLAAKEKPPFFSFCFKITFFY